MRYLDIDVDDALEIAADGGVKANRCVALPDNWGGRLSDR